MYTTRHTYHQLVYWENMNAEKAKAIISQYLMLQVNVKWQIFNSYEL